MKTNYVFLALFLFLGIFLFLSNQLDYKRNRDKIYKRQCKDVSFTPFPEGFVYLDHTSHIQYPTKKNRYAYSSLNLSSLSLKSLPDDIFLDYRNCITKLNLNYNNFNEIPPAVRHLDVLKELDLSRCDISSLNNVDGLRQLERLDLTKNNLSSLSFLPTSKNLNSVNLRENNISIVDLPNQSSSYFLRILDLSHNVLSEFPIELLEINGIEFLNLSENNINFVPSLKPESNYSIKSINLTNNQITKFPSDFGRIKNLYGFYLEQNKIDGKVELLNNHFLDLQEIIIESQYIDSVIIEQTAIPQVTTLKFFDNDIVYFEVQENNKQSFTSLNLRENKLTEFPLDILYLKDLKVCDLSKNMIKGKVVITDSNLETLDLSENEITSIHFAGKNKIKTLNLNDNHLQSFTYDEGALPDLETLYLDNNSNFSKTDITDLINRIKKFSSKSIKGIINVKNNKNDILNLSDYEITEIYFSGKNKMKQIILENTQLSIIHIEEGALQDLEVLDLSRNLKLKNFPLDIFNKAPNLKTIDISGCKNLLLDDVHQIKYISDVLNITCISADNDNIN